MKFFIQSDKAMMRVPKEGEVYIYLSETEWDDRGYHTHYFISILKPGQKQRSGNIRIAWVNQKQGDKHVLSSVLEADSFECIPGGFCSVSHDPALYYALFESLTVVERFEFINGINLILDKESPSYRDFRLNDCFVKSLLRDGAIDCSIIRNGKSLITLDGNFHNPFSTKIYLRLNGYNDFSLDFSGISDIEKHPIVTFIGKNGSGKSTAMYRIARLLYASCESRAGLQDSIGSLVPEDLVFSRLILLSYSSFDNFVMPSESEDLRFAYCGIRDLKAEQKVTEDSVFQDEANDRTRHPVILKSNEALALEFKDFYRRSGQKSNDLKAELQNCCPEALRELEDLNEPYGTDALFYMDNEEIIQFFSKLSTGYKFFYHAIFGILANITEYSVIMFDEPENHMHPPLLLSMLKVIGKVAHNNNSVVLVATHSPLILQETFSRHVLVVRKDGEMCTVSHPTIETYGENASILIREVFDIPTGDYDFCKTIDAFYESRGCDKMESLENVIDAFKPLFPSGISMQAMLHINGLFNRNK